MTSHRTDRILPLIVPIGVWAFIGALIFFLREIEKLVGLYLLWVPLLTVLLGGALVLNLLALIVGAVSRCWRHCAYLVVAPLGIFAVFSSLPLIGVTPEKVRFVVSEPYLAWRIGGSPREPGEPRLMGFDWGEIGGAAGGNVMDYLVYDESDEIFIHDVMEQSIAWRRRAMSELPAWVIDGTGRVEQRFGRHFYLIRYAW